MSKNASPVLAKGMPSRSVQPVAGKVKEPKKWSFSFANWRQIEYFGLNSPNIDNQWLISVLEKFKTLSEEESLDSFRESAGKRDALRFHEIKWDQTNIPVQLKDLDWLPEDVLSNPVEYPFMQFQISMGNGRIIGYFDYNDDFNVVLLDPLHNMQPSQRYGYKVDPCSPFPCVYSQIKMDVTHILEHSSCSNPDCEVKQDLSKLPIYPRFGAIHLTVQESLFERAESLLDTECVPNSEKIFEDGVELNE